MGNCNPEQLLILPDPVMCGEANVESVTSQAGPCTPQVVVDDTNCGNLVPTVFGVPEDPVLDPLRLRVQESGPRGETGFAFRLGASGDWIGADDGRRDHRFYATLLASDDGAADFSQGGESAVLCDKTIILTATDVNAGEIVFFSRQVDALDPYAYTRVDLDPSTIEGAPALDTTTRQRISTAVTSRGVLLMAYTWQTSTDPTYGIALLKSEDCGQTWQCLQRNVLGVNTVATIYNIRLTVSGPWVRLDYFSGPPIANKLSSVASKDGGLSWSDPVQPDFVNDVLLAGPSGEDESPFGVAGLGDGTFVIVFVKNTSSEVSTGVAFGDASYQGFGTFVFPATRQLLGTITAIACAAMHGRVYAYVATEDGPGSTSGDQHSLYYQEAELVFTRGPAEDSPGTPQAGEWQPVEPLSRFRGNRFIGLRADLLPLAGQGLMVYSGHWDHIDDAAVVFKGVHQVGGITARSLGEISPGDAIAALPTGAGVAGYSLYTVMWASTSSQAIGGSTGAGGSTSPDTEWVRIFSGTPTSNWNPRRMRFVTGAAETDFHRWRDATASSSDSWLIRGSSLQFISRWHSGSERLLGTTHGVRVSSIDSANDEITFTVRIASDGVSLYDVKAGTVLASILFDTSRWFEIRVGFIERPTGPVARMWAFHIDDYLVPIGSTGALSLTAAAAAIPRDELTFGGLASFNAGDTAYREVKVATRTNRDVRTATPQESINLGLQASADRTLTQNCLYVGWGGASGAKEDRFDTEPCFLYPAAAVFDQSCRIGWRSGGASPIAAQTLILQADATDDQGRFIHDAVALCGIEDKEVLIDYDGSPAFGSPTPADTLDTTFLTARPVGSVRGATVAIGTPAGTRPPVEGELAGLRARFTSGALTGNTYCITRHCEGVIELAKIVDGQISLPDLTALGLLDGDEVEIFRPFGFIELASPRRQRYMRLRFLDTDTCTGDHRLAAIVAGCKVDVPIPFEWTHTDSTQSDVQVFEGEGGISWAYQRGPARREWVGRVLGDYIRWRESLRYLLDHLAGYEARPLVMIPDKAEQGSMIYGRWNGGGAELENAFWWDTDPGDGTYRYAGGDMTLRILEIP